MTEPDPRVVSLARINISPRAAALWAIHAKAFWQTLGATRPDLLQAPIPDEQARVEENGTLTIFAQVAELRVALNVPASHWAWNSDS